MKNVNLESFNIGEGRPKIILPIVDVKAEDILGSVKQANELPCDLVEWRVDYFAETTNYEEIADLSHEIKEVLKKPLLITFRSSREGGVFEESDEAYGDRYRYILQHGRMDLVDLELFMPDQLVKELTLAAHEQNIKVILCHHNFERTLSKEELLIYLFKMEGMQADICKIAMMPLQAEDVLTLMEATLEANKIMTRPIISMSMGRLGVISRLAGELFGSAATFGIAEQASAPGQLPIEQLDQILNLLKLN